jgi:hypothetical protein
MHRLCENIGERSRQNLLGAALGGDDEAGTAGARKPNVSQLEIGSAVKSPPRTRTID